MAFGTESLDAELLKDLGGLSKPPSFDGNDAEYKTFDSAFRIHMSLVSSVSHALMHRCEVERNPIFPGSSESSRRCKNNLSPSESASTVSYPSKDPSVIGELSCISSVDPWIMGVTINSVSSIRRQAGAEYLLLDSDAQLHACLISYPGQKIPLPDPGIHTASGARLQQHD